MDLDTPLLDFPGVGAARAKALAKLGLGTAGDLMGYFPRDYEDRTRQYTIQTAPLDAPVCIPVIVAETPRLSRIRKGLELTKVKVVDGSAAMSVTFFNQAYVRSALVPGQSYIFYGKVERKGGYHAMTNPVFEQEDKARFTGRIMPVYPLTAGVSNNLLAGLTQRAVPDCAPRMPEALPPEVLAGHDLAPAAFSCENIHFPASFEALALARRRLIFEELFTLSTGLALLRERRSRGEGPAFAPADMEEFYRALPFTLTAAQRRTVAEAAADCCSGRPMNRLVQGDVGSGKTVVAAACGWLAHRSGYQTAMMVPTEILAEQHYQTLTKLLEPYRMTVGLLTGSMRPSEKKRVYAALQGGDIHFVVGTHALLSAGVAFQNLGLVVTDEQHRFGVEQRAALAAKANTPWVPPQAGRRICGGGDSLPAAANEIPEGVPGAASRTGGAELHPHTLVMSATPIPRTLALIIYGDLDVSVIDELPPGRMPVKTLLVGESKRARMYGFVREQAAAGRQVYIICPAVDENPEGAWDLKAVTAYAKHLQTVVFPDLRVGFVHGKLKPKEKEAAMAAFAGGETQVLVATTVVEVGVDVPNANLIIIENADRYGLSQLHQLRGRVGRGRHQSWCVLVSENHSEDTRRRLKVLVDTTDGFRIAEEDLKLRGPGDFFGQRQHGLPVLRVADLNTDTRILKEAQDAAGSLLAQDPDLSRPEHRPLLEKVRRLFAENPDMFN